MNRIAVTSVDAGRYAVEVREGSSTTFYRVRVPDDFLESVGLLGADAASVVEESLAFLLEREPASSILREFSLDQISRYFPEYRDEIRSRMST